MSTVQVEESVKQRAFVLYQQRGQQDGNDQDDWFRAEKEIQNSNGKSKTDKRGKNGSK